LPEKALKNTKLYQNCAVNSKSKLSKGDLVKLLQREAEGYKNIATVVKDLYPVKQRIEKYVGPCDVTELRLGTKLHILTISDLHERSYRKVRTQPGMLTFKSDKHGWMWAREQTTLYPLDRLVKIMNCRDGDGLSGTYFRGEVPKGAPAEKFLIHFVQNLHTNKDQFYCTRPSPPPSPTDSESSSGPAGKIGEYNNYPFLMFCNQDVPETKNLVLISRSKVDKYYLWKVVDTTQKDAPRDIGRAVLMPHLPEMMGDQAGVGLFGEETCISEIGVYDDDAYDHYDYDALEPDCGRVAPCMIK